MKVRGSIYGVGKQLPGDREKFWDHEEKFKGITRPKFISHKTIAAGGVITKTVTIGQFYTTSQMEGHPTATPYLPNLRLISMTVPEGGGGALEVECDFLSGFIDLRNFENGYIDRVMFCKDANAPQTGDPDWSAPSWVRGGENDDEPPVWVTGEWENTDKLLKGYSGSPENYYPDSPTYNQPGWYSGRMREMVQLLNGMDIANPYNFIWAQTHGIWVGADGSWWIVEISAAGITAWRAPICEEMPQEEQDYYGVELPFYPNRNSNEKAGLVELRSAEDMSEFYGEREPDSPQSAIYALCGWSFDSDGHKAINTAQRMISSTKQSSLWRIKITGGDEPTAATLTEVEEAPLWTPGYAAHFKFPAFTQYGPSLMSLKTSYDYGDDPEPPADVLAPVYAYYDADDKEVVLRVGWEAGHDEWFDPVPYRCEVGGITGSGTAIGSIPHGSGTTKGTNDRAYFELKRDGAVLLETKEGRNTIVMESPLMIQSVNIASLGGWMRATYTTAVAEEVWLLQGYWIKFPATGSSVLTESDVIIAPFFERTGLYHAPGKSLRVNGDVYLSSLENTTATGELWYYSGSNTYDCGYTPSGSTAFAWGGTEPWKTVGGLSETFWAAAAWQPCGDKQYDEELDRTYFCINVPGDSQGGSNCNSATSVGLLEEGRTFELHHELHYLAPEDDNFTELFKEVIDVQASEDLHTKYRKYGQFIDGEALALGAAQQMAMYLDTHHNVGPISAEMDGLAGDTYEYLGNTQDRYPLEGLPDNLWRAWFGAPNPEET